MAPEVSKIALQLAKLLVSVPKEDRLLVGSYIARAVLSNLDEAEKDASTTFRSSEST
jgi:hypothetical protein